MASTVTHQFVSTVPDGADNTLVQPGDWNDDHDFTLEADDVVFTPEGSVIVATTVQGAISELEANLGTGGGSGDVSTDAIWTAKGDLVVGTGDDTSIRLSVGTDGQVLVADSAQTRGVRWASLVGITIPITFGSAGPVTVTTEADNPPPFRWYNDTGVTLVFAATRASATVGPSGSTMTIDVNKDGNNTIFGATKLVLPNNSGAASTVKQSTFATTTVADGSWISVNIDTAGGGAVRNLQVTVWMVG